MKEFVQQDKNISQQLQSLKNELGERLDEHDVQLLAIYDAIENLMNNQTDEQKTQERKRIGYKN